MLPLADSVLETRNDYSIVQSTVGLVTLHVFVCPFGLQPGHSLVSLRLDAAAHFFAVCDACLQEGFLLFTLLLY